MTDVSSILNLVQRYGLFVFPVKYQDKVPCRVASWIHEASADPKQIAAWFTGSPLNVGIACGPSRLLIIDEDTPGAFEKYAADTGVAVPYTLTVQTGRGRHYYFRTKGNDFGNHEGALHGHDINVRGSGGYVVGPGSIHANGSEYVIRVEATPAPIPPWLIDTLNGHRQPDTSSEFTQPPNVKPFPGIPEVIPKGKRHSTIMKYACSLRERGIPDHEALVLIQAAWHHCEPSSQDEYPWIEAHKTLLDVYERYPAGGVMQMHNVEDEDQADARTAMFAKNVNDELWRLQVREAARTAFSAQQTSTALPTTIPLPQFLATPDEDTTYRIESIWPTGGRVVLSAPKKTGKTTIVANLIRALADNTKFLDKYATDPPARILLIDDELDQRMLRRWLREQTIVNTERVEVLSLRGQLSTFNILDEDTRSRWAEQFPTADILIFDCLRPALDALGLSEDKDAGRFLVALDELTMLAGITDTFVVHHMGHQNERSRGDSRIEDWPDAIWRLVIPEKQDEEDDPKRRVYFTAHGRDVDQPEAELTYDHATRHLRITGGSRSDHKAEGARQSILDYLGEGEGRTKNVIEKALGGIVPQQLVRTQLEQLVISRELVKEPTGQRGGGYTYRRRPNDL